MSWSPKDFYFEFPEKLVALQPSSEPRVLWNQSGSTQEISWPSFLEHTFWQSGDVLVFNDTKVLPRRVSCLAPGGKESDVFFISQKASNLWEVLTTIKGAKGANRGEFYDLPEGVQGRVTQKGRPQVMEVNQVISEDYFERHARLALPPYIESKRKYKLEDKNWYQTSFAQSPGALAAPTAGLHFKENDLQMLKLRGVGLAPVTLHVGPGTFLPLVEGQIELHEEEFFIPNDSWDLIQSARRAGKNIWALGTTSVRAIESYALGLGQKNEIGIQGRTKLFIRPGFQFQVVDRVLTNFHQPESSLMALVSAFYGLPATHKSYRWAIEKEFRLFSYGDLSVWIR